MVTAGFYATVVARGRAVPSWRRLSFETMWRHFGLDDPVLSDVARIVHEADLADDRFDSPEAPGLDAICRGLSMVRGDNDVLAVSAVVFYGIYEFRRRALLGQEPS